MRTVETSMGRVTLQGWGAYASPGTPSMGSMSSQTGAGLVLLLKEGIDPESLSMERIESMVKSIHESVAKAVAEGSDEH